MRLSTRSIRPAVLLAAIVAQAAAIDAGAQERTFLTVPAQPQAGATARAAPPPPPPDSGYHCRGPISQVTDVAFPGVKVTSFNWSSTAGGGQSGRFDRTPVLSTTVQLAAGTCLDAHFSALVGSKQTYGFPSAITMFQVSLTRIPGGTPLAMAGAHFPMPYSTPGPSVAFEAERDVDMFAANFFQRVGSGPGTVPPGTYRVDAWWSGGPVGGGGAIGAAFVLKLYHR